MRAAGLHHLPAGRGLGPSRVRNLLPAACQATAIGDDTTTYKLALAFLSIFIRYRRATDLLPALRSGLAATQRLGDRDAEARILECLAEVYAIDGSPGRTAEFCQRAMAIWDQTGNPAGQWAAWHMQGVSFLGPEQFGEAMNCFQQALEAARGLRILKPRACP